MLKKLHTMLIVFLLYSAQAFAQVNISGTVIDAETGEALPGASVVLTEINRGTATGVDGSYTITGINAGNYTLVATFVGYERFQTTINVGNQDIALNIQLRPSVQVLSEFVVTAFGIQRESRALGYGVSEVQGASLEKRAESDVVRSLAGKLPGVNITNTGGVSGSATNFIIRGYTSISGSNQPLFVVDGVRFDGGVNGSGDWYAGGGSLTSPNRFLDIDPKNIESVTVLKGLNATTIYGEQGRNGVVLINTKSGNIKGGKESGFSITFEQTLSTVEIASTPDYQNTYGGGFDQAFGWFFSNWGPRFDDTTPTTYGSLYRGLDTDGTVLVRHPYQNNGDVAAGFPEFQGSATYRYEAKPNPIDAFFRTGKGANTSLNISGGVKDVRLNVSFSQFDENGFTLGNKLSRSSFGMGANYKINSKWSAQTTFNMSLTDMKTPPISAGYGSGSFQTPSVFADVFYTPRNIDLDLPYQNPIDGSPAYYRGGNDIQHPKWTVNNAKVSSVTDRYFGKSELNFELFKGLNAIYRLGYDSYTENYSYTLNKGNVADDGIVGGLYQTMTSRNQIWDHNANLLLSFQLGNLLSLDGLAGAQYVTEKFDRTGIESQNQIIFNVFTHSNFLDKASTNYFSGGNLQYQSERKTAGVFADVTVGFSDWLYVNASARNDWFSTLEKDNRSVFYPAASVSWIPTDMLGISNPLLTYLKVRAGIGTSAGSPNVYSTRNTLASNSRAFIDGSGSVYTTNATSSFLGNPNLKPELHQEMEYGVETRWFNGRIGLNATYYDKTTTDLITRAPVDPATGFTSTFINIGEINNTGIELELSATPLTGFIQWDISANYFADDSEVIELGGGLTEIQVGGGFTNRGNFAVKGEPLGIMKGDVIQRVKEGPNKGTPIITANGNYAIENDIGIIGNPNPDYQASMINTLSVMNFTFSFQVDYQAGGDIYSTWISTLFARGLTTDTDRVDRNNTFILPGVREVNGEFVKNTIQLSPSGVFFSNFGFGADEMAVYDATHIRLSEVSLSYDIPAMLLNVTPLEQVTVSVIGNNLWFFAPYIPEGSGFDPNVNSIGVGNARGFEYLTGPSARRFAASVKVRF